MSNNKQSSVDWLEMFSAPLCFGGFIILIIHVILCDYFSIDIDRGGKILIPICISYYLIWKIIFKGGNNEQQ